MNVVTDETAQAPFNFGEHVRYVGGLCQELPAGAAGHEVVLAPGMVGVVILSSGSAVPWHCRVQFRNGFQVDVTPANRAQFEPTVSDSTIPV